MRRCSKLLPMERRLTTIFTADVAGYSRLMEADEQGTYLALQKHLEEVIKPQIDRYSGRLIKLMGDGVLAEFASVVDAVSCAIAIQDSVGANRPETLRNGSISWRIGIHLGSGCIDFPSAARFTAPKRSGDMSDLFWLTDAQMARLEPYFPKSHGKPRVDDRRVLSGIIFINRNGLRWRDAPEAYGPHKTLYSRWKRWSEKGIFARMMVGLAAEHSEQKTIMIDATYLKAHRTATSMAAKKGGVVA